MAAANWWTTSNERYDVGKVLRLCQAPSAETSVRLKSLRRVIECDGMG